ncbi:response regulator transcription factor [Sphingomonas nostoxanthinifaciens]|uniref:response regulator transcription factor n=1 Tax=Sphingomonas nostoxanthinifaciens TaxID=2872652 RepID=UPI001CC1E289|nr:response regulator transcription factor [Sphingomonas nostoxanthinifaciens]UAK23088.1 response regulator transcription factor [Sphingomonas nostoxanthinifaciens]
MSDKPLVHLIDDEESVRRSTSFNLRVSGYEVKTYVSGIEFLKVAQSVMPGCVLLDIRMPDMDGLEVQEQLRARGIAMPVVVLTGHGDVPLAVRAMKAGAVDFLEKPFEKAVLVAAIARAVERLNDTGRRIEDRAEAQLCIGALTARERDVLEGLANGHPNKTIAYDLDISARTVEVHRANLMSKLRAQSLSEALRIAFAAGMPNEEH